MNSVMISIQPKWCELILSGKKTAEVRKTIPAGAKEGVLEEPFKCFIYCTSVKSLNLKDYVELHKVTGGAIDDWSGMVIGEFMCNGIYHVCYTMDGFADMIDCNTTCMKPSEFIKYGKGKRLYKWYISQLKVYDKPKDLSAFCYPPEKYCEKELCGGCPYEEVPNQYGEYENDCDWERPLQRAPQSWCYVQEITARQSESRDRQQKESRDYYRLFGGIENLLSAEDKV